MTFDRRAFPADSRVTLTPAKDGWPLRTYHQPARGPVRGSILWLGGRGDIFEKYLESFDAWTAGGRSVTSFDWRGQGGSGRTGGNPQVGHFEDFAPWVDDLADFYASWSVREPGPHIVMAHSMGGHLVLRALAERRIAPDGVVLSAPMLGFDTDFLPFPVATALASVLARVTTSRRPAWKNNERPAPPSASRQGFLTHDLDRYGDELWWKEQNPALMLGPPSWAWLGAAYRSVTQLRRPGAVEHIRTPMLIIGTDGDRLVSPIAIREFAARMPHAKLVMLDQTSAHEVLRERDEPRDRLMAEIAAFLDSVA